MREQPPRSSGAAESPTKPIQAALLALEAPRNSVSKTCRPPGKNPPEQGPLARQLPGRAPGAGCRSLLQWAAYGLGQGPAGASPRADFSRRHRKPAVAAARPAAHPGGLLDPSQPMQGQHHQPRGSAAAVRLCRASSCSRAIAIRVGASLDRSGMVAGLGRIAQAVRSPHQGAAGSKGGPADAQARAGVARSCNHFRQLYFGSSLPGCGPLDDPPIWRRVAPWASRQDPGHQAARNAVALLLVGALKTPGLRFSRACSSDP